MMKHYVRLACFVGGALFGSAGVKLLTSKDAKKAYTHITAAGLRMKDSVMETVTTVQENAADILASAKDGDGHHCPGERRRHPGLRQGHQRGPGRPGGRGSGGGPGGLKTAEGSRRAAPFFHVPILLCVPAPAGGGNTGKNFEPGNTKGNWEFSMRRDF